VLDDRGSLLHAYTIFGFLGGFIFPHFHRVMNQFDAVAVSVSMLGRPESPIH